MEVSRYASDQFLEKDGPHIRPPSVTMPDSPKQMTELQTMNLGYTYDYPPPPKYTVPSSNPPQEPGPPSLGLLARSMAIADDTYSPYGLGHMAPMNPIPPECVPYYTPPPPPLIKREQGSPFPPPHHQQQQNSSPAPQYSQENGIKVPLKNGIPSSIPQPQPSHGPGLPPSPYMGGAAGGIPGAGLLGGYTPEGAYKWQHDSRQPPGKIHLIFFYGFCNL